MQRFQETVVSLTFSRLHTLAISGIFGIFVVPMSALHAAPPELSLPIDCKIGETCWLVNFVDHDPGPRHQDYRCGSLSYDTHQGTDIALANDAAMRAGVAVLAAAPGRVTRVRDGEPRTTARDLESVSALQGRECGNGVIIDHGDDWTTQYCHMKAGSLVVSPGDTVQRGDVLGDVGRSGRTEFPHVHLTVRNGNTVMDPFTSTSNISACQTGTDAQGLWSPSLAQTLSYPGPQPYHLGFATAAPDTKDIRAGTLGDTDFSPTSPALVFWAEVFSLTTGDKIFMSLAGPDGKLIAKSDVVLDRPKARIFRFTGRKRRGAAWDTGTYHAEIRIVRGHQTVTRTHTATIR